MKVHDVEQGSPEWFEVRKGKMTASHATEIGNCGKGLETYIVDLMSEVYSYGEEEKFGNGHTERGNEYEPVARAVYEMERGVEVQDVGFIEHSEFVGCSPDGLVGEDGGIEIKSVQNKKHFRHMLNGQKEIDSGYVWQVQMNLLVTGREWWDLVIYNPNYSQSMCVYRILPDKEKFAALQAGFKAGEEMIKSIRAKIK